MHSKIFFLESGLTRLSFLNYIRPCFWLEWARFLQGFKRGRMIVFPDFYFFWRIVSKLGKIESCWTRGLARIRGIRILRSAFTFLLRSIGASFRAGCDIFVIVALLFSFMDVVVSGTKVYEAKWESVTMENFECVCSLCGGGFLIMIETNFINLINHFFFYLFQVSKQ